jgi:hypothetical protein
MRVEGVTLEDHRDAPCSGGQVGDNLSPDQYVSGSRFFQTGDHAQQSGFATSRWAQQNKEFFVAADNVHTVNRLYLTKVFEQTLRLYLGQSILLLVAGYLRFIHL